MDRRTFIQTVGAGAAVSLLTVPVLATPQDVFTPQDVCLSGIDQIDLATGGLGRGELAVLAGGHGHHRDTVTLNWAYNQAIRYHRNVVYQGIPEYDLRARLWALHSRHEKFSHIPTPLLYPATNLILEDLSTNPEYGTFHVGTPENVSAPFDLWVLDYPYLGGLDWRAPDTWSKVRDRASRFNCSVLAMVQINRQAYTQVSQRAGQYEMSDFPNSDALGKLADAILTSYSNGELRARNRIRMSCLKTRSGSLIQNFEVGVDGRRLYNVES